MRETLKELYDVWKTSYKTRFSKGFRGLIYGLFITKGAIDFLYNPNQITNDIIGIIPAIVCLESSITLEGYRLKLRSLNV